MSVSYLYKYAVVDATTISNLVNGVIYFNAVENFNDPTDSEFIILPDREGSEALSSDEIKKVFEFMDVPFTQELMEKDNFIYRTQLGRLLQDAIKKYIGVSCFSKHDRCSKCDYPSLSPLMLSHYADGHNGIVIEYECFDESNIKEIRYCEESQVYDYSKIIKGFKSIYTPINRLFDFTSQPIKSLEINEKIIQPLLFKFKLWEHQQEVRIFSKQMITEACSKNHLKARSIYFGNRLAQDVSECIKTILAEKDLNFYYLGLPVSHNERQSIIIFNENRQRLNTCTLCAKIS